MKLGVETNSLINHIYSGYITKPEAGKDCTVLHWTDRSAYKCTWVSEDGKQCKIQRYKIKRTDDGGYYTEDQDYAYDELEGPEITLHLSKKGQWRSKTPTIHYDEKALKATYGNDYSAWKQAAIASGAYDEFNDFHALVAVVKGITKAVTIYNTYNVLWGVAKEYRDPSF